MAHVEAVDAAALDRIANARAAARAWAGAAGKHPAFYVIDFDATLVTSHSEKQGAAANYKHGFGFHPLLAFLDATGEALAGILRPGTAGSNTTPITSPRSPWRWASCRSTRPSVK